MRYLSTLYVRNHRARIGHRRGSLLVSTPDGKQRVPLEGIDALVLLGGGQVTSQALEACAKRGVRVAALRQSGSIRFVVSHKTGGNVHLRTALYRAVSDEGWSLAISRVVVAAKLQNSRKVLGRWSRDATDPVLAGNLARRAERLLERIPRLKEAPTPDHVRGIEGDAARIYFRGVGEVLAGSGIEFLARRKRPPRDPVNSALGFCYGLLVTELIGAIESVGLDYQMGFFHRPRSGRPSLALDLAEELKPFTDRFVVSLMRRRQLCEEEFVRTPGGAVYLGDDGRRLLLRAWEKHKETQVRHAVLQRNVGRWAIPSVQATLLARHLRGDLSSYPSFVMP